MGYFLQPILQKRRFHQNRLGAEVEMIPDLFHGRQNDLLVFRAQLVDNQVPEKIIVAGGYVLQQVEPCLPVHTGGIAQEVVGGVGVLQQCWQDLALQGMPGFDFGKQKFGPGFTHGQARQQHGPELFLLTIELQGFPGKILSRALQQ